LGVFDGQRFELIDGELLDKMGQKPPHASTIVRLNAILSRLYPDARVRIQLPMEAGGSDCDRSVPEPDAAVMRQSSPERNDRHPRGSELILAVEVADSSSAVDLGRKAEIYANSAVPEYWVVDLDLKRRVVMRHREPRGGVYRLLQPFLPGETLPVEGHPEGIRVDELLPPAE
jgi:Uma2 family endonuclease